ncbi:hypothetical protein ABZP36_002975 [Zizania latifolia]
MFVARSLRRVPFRFEAVVILATQPEAEAAILPNSMRARLILRGPDAGEVVLWPGGEWVAVIGTWRVLAGSGSRGPRDGGSASVWLRVAVVAEMAMRWGMAWC